METVTEAVLHEKIDNVSARFDDFVVHFERSEESNREEHAQMRREAEVAVAELRSEIREPARVAGQSSAVIRK